jgi:hypothetical protein
MKYLLLCMCVALPMAHPAHAQGARASAEVKVDGFQVKILPPPTKARLAHPTSTTGSVLVEKGSGSHGTDPFRHDAGLAGHSKYLSVQGASTATFVLPQPALKFKLLWGSPDTDNFLAVYDTAGALINTISGATLDKKLGISNSNDYVLSFRSKTPIGSVVFSSTTCCFELDNLRFKPTE